MSPLDDDSGTPVRVVAPEDTDSSAGRPITLVPLAPGVWTVVTGCGIMVLGPLFGFLLGSVLGTNRLVAGMSPIFFFLLLGFLVAGVGAGVAMLGARRVWLDYVSSRPIL